MLGNIALGKQGDNLDIKNLICIKNGNRIYLKKED